MTPEAAPAQMIRPQNIGAVWPFASPWLQKAIERNGMGYELTDLREGLELGKFQLWSSASQKHRGFLITEVVPTKYGREVHLILAGGYGLELWFPELGIIELWAKEIGAYDLKIWGRKGWERLLRKQGYKLETQVMHRRLDFGVQ